MTIDVYGNATIMEVDARDAGAHLTYMEAHQLLPPGYPTSEAEMRLQVALAVATLEDERASSEAVLRAIMILGHSPDALALASLRARASSGGEHADMADLAADECEHWIASASRMPRPAPQASPMPN